MSPTAPLAPLTAPSPQFTAPNASQQGAATAIGAAAPQASAQTTDAVTAYAKDHNLAPELVSQFVTETGHAPSDNLFEWAQAKGYWNGQSGPNERWTWHKTLPNGLVASQGTTGVVGDPTKGFTIQPNGNTEDILRKMLTTQDYGLTNSGDTSLSNLAGGLNSGNVAQILQQALHQTYAAQDPTKPDTRNLTPGMSSWTGAPSTDPGGVLHGFIQDQLNNRMRWVNENNQDENTTINNNLRSLLAEHYSGLGATPGGQYRQATDPERYLAALPNPNKIVGRNFLDQSRDTQQFLLGAYEQPDAAGNENGYSANDVIDTIQKGLPQFTAPKAGSIRYG